MGRIDTEAKRYMADNARFADAFNYYLYDGKQVIDPYGLTALDTTEIAVPYGDGNKVPVQKYRDLLKSWQVKTNGRAIYALLGTELESEVNYAMPVKAALYDSMHYAKQVESARKSLKEQKEPLNHGEFLSGFRKEDRLIPVITIVLLFNADTWDGPRSIHEMLSIHDAGLLKYIPDYRINLVAPAELQENEYRKFHTPLGQVIEYIRVSRDKDKLDQLIQKDPRYSRMDRDSANLINAVTNSKLTYPEEGDEIDMCKAIDDMRADAKAEGIEEGRAEGRAVGIEEGRVEGKTESLVSSIKNVMDSIHVSIEEAMDILKVDPQKRQEYAARVK